MSIGASSTSRVVAEDSVATALEVEVSGRWDALALSELLIPFHSFLVQYTAERWVVRARTPGCHGEQLQDALLRIEEWRVESGVHAPVRHYDLGERVKPTR